MEAITSRRLLLAAVGKATSKASPTTPHLTPLHGRADVMRRRLANLDAALRHVKAPAEQFTGIDRWACLLRYVNERIVASLGPPRPPPPAVG